MESDIINSTDVISINIQLNELRSKFDQAMREGIEGIDLRETYLQIKELECHLNALQWDPEHPMIHANTASPAWM